MVINKHLAISLLSLVPLALSRPVLAIDTPLPFSAASTPLASQVLQDEWADLGSSASLDWRYSFVSTPLVRQQMAATANRLSAEIELIAARYEIGAAGSDEKARYVEALHAWQAYVDQGRANQGHGDQGHDEQVLAESTDQPAARASDANTAQVLARMPGQLDPLRDMRNGPQAIRIAPGMVIGACKAPETITVMDARGVHERQWQPNLTLDALINERSDADALGHASHASLVTPQGQVLTRPIARWNRLTSGEADLPIAPGASVVIDTPGIDTSQQWVNEALPRWLASHLPGHDCQSWQLDAATLPSR